ncbi:hypothetical protein GCM10011352_33240 [Marinobacterium zhoushanense]|uniref:Tetratricopeptide repeat protein n=1 Tax=Marinobacterium zhoushanense TaxID=1679163 RepID=A0ABQ1KSX3_9GAMM|nr:tetratricopeptide repeat protein [Marinobacterium zhoushanense]GGC04410.1 hypothetical protein GCM10011352_33240 [Marinobacterium zhoushanense]
MRIPGFAILFGALLLGGCAGQASQGPDSAALSTPPATPQAPVQYQPGELNQESVYELLAAEIAGQRRQFDQALGYYLHQARMNHDPAIAERATRIAQFLRNAKAVVEAAGIWAEIEPANPEPKHILANILISERRFDEALPILEQILDDGSAEAVLMIGAHSNQMPVDTARLYERLLARYSEQDPERLEVLLTRALLKRRMDDDQGALKLIDQGLAVEPGQTDLLQQKVEILRKQGDSDQALQLVRQALKSNPDTKPLKIQYVQLQIDSAPKRALKAMLELADAYPEDDQLHYYFALLALDHKQYDASRQLLNTLLLRNPNNANLHFYLGIVEEDAGEPEVALSHYLRVTEGPNLQQAYNRALSLLEHPEQEARVRKIIAQGIDDHPELGIELTLMLADWLHNQDQRDEALNLLEQALAKHPKNVGLLYSHALMIEPEDPQRMLSELETALRLEPDNGMLLNALGYSLTLYSDDYSRAHTLISQALEQHPDDAAVLDSMGWVLYKLGRLPEALNFLRRAHNAFDDPEVASHLIEVLWASGETEEALELLRSSLQSAPDDERLRAVADKLGVDG